jgi:segregation and condensation protein A
MSRTFAITALSGYKVNTPVFKGPLDLLLNLIERAELDITKVSLAQVTDQYLAYLHNIREQALDEASEFLTIAAKLIQIKSEVLLPRPPQREEGEQDPGAALIQQLILYKQFKNIAAFLAEHDGRSTYLRLAPPPKLEAQVDLKGIDIHDLVAIATDLFTRTDNRQELHTVVTPPPVTIRQKIRLIGDLLRQGRTSFLTLIVGARSRIEIVVTFLAMLELIKREKINANQETNFSEITLETIGSWDQNEEFELEFGE